MKKWRIFNIKIRSLPGRKSYPALTFFVLRLTVVATFPADATISTKHIGNRRSCPCCLEHIRHSDQLSNLYASPALSLDTDIFCIHPFPFRQVLGTAYYIIVSTFCRMSICITDIRCKNQVSATHEKRNIQTAWSW